MATPNDKVVEAVKRWDEALDYHASFVRAYEAAERAYHGVMEVSSRASRWRSKVHPPYAFNLIETMVSNTIEENLRLACRPSPKSNLSLEEAQLMLAQTENLEYLLRHEHRVDEMDAKQRPLFLLGALSGRAIGKVHWNWHTGSVKRQGVKMLDVMDDQDNLLGQVPIITEVEYEEVIADHSTTEVVDPRDFVLHPAARALQPTEPGGSQYLFHRCWYSYEQLKAWERAGFVKNVDQLKESRDFSTGDYKTREQHVWELATKKDLIEVLEYWCYKDGKVWRTLIGNRAVELRAEEANPFNHGHYPFFTANSMPNPLSPWGTADITLIAQLQDILWELMNHRLDNLELINNAILLIRSDVQDPESFEYFPGARWQVDDPNSVQNFAPPYQLAELTMGAEALIKGDLQNVTSAAPFAGGADSASIDQETATGVSIIMSAAQKRLAAKKYQSMLGLKREASQRLKLCQQFIDDKRLVHILGHDGSVTFREIDALAIQGDFIVELEPMSESLMRQEKRAEALQFVQVTAQLAPVMQATGSPLNMKAVFDFFLKKWDIEDGERFFSAQPQPALMGGAPAGPGGGGGLPQPGGAIPSEPNMGITAASAVDASSPSATGGMSLSPEMMMQRAGAMSGGVSNTG